MQLIQTGDEETDETNPKSIYGVSKHEGELAVSQIDKHIILRVAWVFSSHGNNFVKTMLRLGEERSNLKIVDDQTGCPTWSGDIARVVIRLLNKYKEHNELKWGVYHFTGQPAVSWFQFAEKIFKAFDNSAVEVHHKLKLFFLLTLVPFVVEVATQQPSIRPHQGPA